MGTVALRVLLVEDDPDDGELLLRGLEASGYQPAATRVWTERDYRACLSEPFDVILADYTMPGFGARAALRILGELACDIPLIVVTGTIGEEVAVACMREGAADYLLKDRLTRLSPAVEQAIVARRAREDKRLAQEALEEQLRFEQLLSKLSTRLMATRAEEAAPAIIEVLGEVADSQHLERAVVFLLNDARDAFQLTHEWCAAFVPSLADCLDGGSVKSDAFPFSVVSLGQTVVSRRTRAGSGASLAMGVFERDCLDVFITLPLHGEGEIVGAIGFHRRDADLELREDFLGRLNLLVQMIASTLARQRSEERRLEAFTELARLKHVAERERDYLREELRQDRGFRQIVGESSSLRAVLELVDAVASTRATVLIRGESGVGKELIARAIHERSGRSTGPLVKVNCASIPKELFESEFFGHVKGSFTGAHRNREGRFELAHGGSIFLDEVGDIPLDMQAKLLRVLQESAFERVGDDRTREVDVRVIAATHQRLESMVAAGTFRADLFYRLNVFPIDVPSLRDRRDDIVPLARFFMTANAAAMHRPGLVLSPEQEALLRDYGWPGNIRELQHVIERAVILSPTPPFRLELALPVAGVARSHGKREVPVMTEADVRDLERTNLMAVLEKAGWQISGEHGAAQLLGVHPSTLRDRMKALGIQRREG